MQLTPDICHACSVNTSQTFAPALHGVACWKKTVTKETLTSSVTVHFQTPAFPTYGNAPFLRPQPIGSAHFFPTRPLTSCTRWPRTARRRRQGEQRRESPSCRRKPSRRRVALVHMHRTKRRDFTDEVRSPNVDPSGSSASGTTVLPRYFNCFLFFFTQLAWLTAGYLRGKKTSGRRKKQHLCGRQELLSELGKS